MSMASQLKALEKAVRWLEAWRPRLTNAHLLVNPFSFINEHEEWFEFEKYKQDLVRKGV